ncbi:hypothetical protein NFJ02_05g121460 [Pycnococcus provasolii]|uniref:Uncharacterized protein n=1 Tax=Pycnococcus provasolii TaxID=41880 RepID=A0A7S2YW65_9CHLO|mmetsp:Transcript_2266/g.5597  ORF Transcript_2266/g.5597 Transcript_2266/m.5597 type:complete len:753 (+) Transcript_2266:516-2774(+)|eukprot:CAMPEP_0119194640 /NCGR_PEP_ID=MMETSP1316-20130426/4343_1 /TAXON_ID=41880 /ORGANISM="Pycnococcus provasolii, Strain RCC2336" /LENGTH=752 /DNA_ID=CAMNT_0007189989 /DNA_START=423 /DNA_END=2681 /DNA_ORIENTATION=-
MAPWLAFAATAALTFAGSSTAEAAEKKVDDYSHHTKFPYEKEHEYKDFYDKFDKHTNEWHDEHFPTYHPKPYHWDKSNGKYRVGSAPKPHIERFYKDYGYWPSWDYSKYGAYGQEYRQYLSDHRPLPHTYKYGQKYPVPKSLKQGTEYTQPFEHPSLYGKGWYEYKTGLHGLRNTGKYSTGAYKKYGYYGPAYKPFQAFKVINKEEYVPPYVHIGKGSPVSPYYGSLDLLYKKEFQEYPGSPKYLHELYNLQRKPFSQTKYFTDKHIPYQIVKQAQPHFWDYSYKTDYGEKKKESQAFGPGDYYADSYSVPVTLFVGGEEFTCNIGYTDMKNPLAWKRCLTYPVDGQKYTEKDLRRDLQKYVDLPEGAKHKMSDIYADHLVKHFFSKNGKIETSSIAKPHDQPEKFPRATFPMYWNPGYYKTPVFAKFPGYYSRYYPKDSYYSKLAGWSPKYGKWVPRYGQDIHLHEKKPIFVPGLYTPEGVHYPVFDSKTGKYDHSLHVKEYDHLHHGGAHLASVDSRKRPYVVADKYGSAKYYNKWDPSNIEANMTYKFKPAYYKGTLDDQNPFYLPRAALWAPAYSKAHFYPGYLNYIPDAKPYAAYILKHPKDLPDPIDLDWKVKAFGPYAYPGYRIKDPGTYTFNIFERNNPSVYGFKYPWTKYKTDGYWKQEEPPTFEPKYKKVIVKGKKGAGSQYENAMGLFWNNYKHINKNKALKHLPPKNGYQKYKKAPKTVKQPRNYKHDYVYPAGHKHIPH